MATVASLGKRISDVHDDVSRQTILQADVVGVTTSGLARNIKILRQAAEVKEPDLISALMPGVEHFIQIGDHRQLRPQIQNYLQFSLETPAGRAYQLDRSQFERRAVGEPGLPPLPVAQLNVQRRMRPEISNLIRSVYPNLKDHDSVRNLPAVVGMRDNLFWLDHSHPEDSKDDGARVNTDIALLTPYTGQLQKLRAALNKEFEVVLSDRDRETLLKEGFEIKQQGENEEDEKPTSGPRKAIEKKELSRAIRLATNVPMRADILRQLTEMDAVGTSIALCCPRHPDTPILCSEPGDFGTKSPEGGCSLICDQRLEPCGHRCPAPCHSQQLHGAFYCLQRCPRLRSTRQHPFPKPCGQECGPCNAKVDGVKLPCGQTHDNVACHRTLDLPSIKCSQPVEKQVPRCGHTVTVPRFKDVAWEGLAEPARRNARSDAHILVAAKFARSPVLHASRNALDTRVDLMEFKTYGEIDLDQTPIAVLGCGHFFTGETLDGLVGMSSVYTTDNLGSYNGLREVAGEFSAVPACPDCRVPIRQFATRRYNRVVNKAVLDETSKRFLVSGRHRLDELEKQATDVETSLTDSRDTGKLKSDRYKAANGLDKEAAKLRRDMEAEHQPTKKLFDARQRCEGQLGASAAGLRLTNHSGRSPAAAADPQDAILRDAFTLASKRPSDLALCPLFGGKQLDKLSARFLHQCQDLIAKASQAKLPRIVIPTCLGYARIVQLDEYLAKQEKEEDRTETARELLTNALALEVDETMRLFESTRYEEVTPAEIAAIKAAMVSSPDGIATHSGHWYRCPNGHPFTIRECGMFMERARCPECGEAIGGQNHRPMEGTQRDMRMELA
ncbi:hypothetical protein C8A03DRAFT_45620 [Achaetomium macrosporum]|uniref:RZ-type domain-containing protein n=1 Tax=Achaetomium macrosporum TaxID=79813 RepID=A0AAN7C6P7_9PEZI|nr:hypothetical protein C8A03DRAFT_45620 [Achaetomium macrosporum]